MDLEDALEELSRETTELSYRLQVVEEEVQKLTSEIDVVEEVKELQELVKYILKRIKLTPSSDEQED